MHQSQIASLYQEVADLKHMITVKDKRIKQMQELLKIKTEANIRLRQAKFNIKSPRKACLEVVTEVVEISVGPIIKIIKFKGDGHTNKIVDQRTLK